MGFGFGRSFGWRSAFNYIAHWLGLGGITGVNNALITGDGGTPITGCRE